MYLSRTKTFGPGGGVLAHLQGFLSAVDCGFVRSRWSGVEIRENASCSLQRCEMESNAGGAFTLYQGGTSAILEDCKILKCGQTNQRGAVMVECGSLVMRGCTVQDNPGDGIVVQDTDGTAHLEISNSLCNTNAKVGMVLYGGSANISNCRIQENGMMGVACHSNQDCDIPFREARLIQNIIEGSQTSIIWSGVTQHELRKLHLEGNRADKLAMFLPCRQSDIIKAFKAGVGNNAMEGIYQKVKKTGGLGETIWCDPMTGLVIDKDDTHSIQTQRSRVAIQNQTQINPDMGTIAFNKQALMDSHERALEQMAKIMQDVPRGTWSDNGVVRAPAAASMLGLAEWQITDVIATIGQRATGKVLYGVICAEAIRLRSLQTIIEDEHGNAVPISLYNISAVELPHWRQCFPIGMRLGIREPFLKGQADASVAIRVDFPSDLIYLTRMCAWHGCCKPKSADLQLFRCSRCLNTTYCST